MSGDHKSLLLPTRRGLLTGAASVATLSGLSAFPRPAIAQDVPLKVGFMLPYSGTFAKLGQFIDSGFRLYVDQKGGKLGGRTVQYVQVDDESKPENGTDNMNRLVSRDKVDVVIGTVHSGVALAMVKVARDTNTMLIIPNAGANDATARSAPPTSSAPRSRTGSPTFRWARSCTTPAIATSRR
jgi:branched-chain amino acid transport system substrate-binding protein